MITVYTCTYIDSVYKN